MAIDTRNQLNNSIPLGMYGNAGNYIFKVNTNSLPTGSTIYLIDSVLNTQTVLKQDSSYAFSITADTTTYGEHRFSLLFNYKQAIIAPRDSSTSTGLQATVLGNIVTGSSVGVQVSGAAGPVVIRVLDMDGHLLQEIQGSNGISYINTGRIASGMVIMQVNDGKNTVIRKIIKQ